METQFFGKLRQVRPPHIREVPKFDLDTYIANYKGKTRFDRLYLIGTSSIPLASEALKSAIVEAKQGKDVGKYDAAVSALREISPDDPNAKPDLSWIERTSKQVKAETDRLETELKGYKNNLIKESIRMGYDDLGQHYHRIGDLASSVRSFARMRDYCTTPSHIVIMNLRLINVSVDQRNWLAVQTNVQRLRTPGQRLPESDKLTAKLSAAMALALLESGNFKHAAEEFIEADPRMVQAKLDDPTDEEAYNEVITPNDIAVYGGLCALASMSRKDLQRRVLDNHRFRSYLELEPHIRRAISFFVSSKFSSCLAILESYKSDYLLDLHLHHHLLELYAQIRNKAIQQYFIPFSSVTLASLADAFNTEEHAIESELTSMIKRGNLDARIDLVDRLLLARTVDERAKAHENAVATSKKYGRTAHLRILRMEALGSNLDVKPERPLTRVGNSGGIAVEDLMEESGMGNGSLGSFLGKPGLRSGGAIR
ncbi:MAG: hypothetical protein LQ342_005565 [Letrouitia transgressa]|nr:MAG: hypothetical protein LQ342_005565 [Letrouitia transgressa]